MEVCLITTFTFTVSRCELISISNGTLCENSILSKIGRLSFLSKTVIFTRDLSLLDQTINVKTVSFENTTHLRRANINVKMLCINLIWLYFELPNRLNRSPILLFFIYTKIHQNGTCHGTEKFSSQKALFTKNFLWRDIYFMLNAEKKRNRAKWISKTWRDYISPEKSIKSLREHKKILWLPRNVSTGKFLTDLLIEFWLYKHNLN